MNGYELSRKWFDFSFERPECKVHHTALFLWIVELNNRLGWKETFGLPTGATMEGLSIGDKRTYFKVLDDLVSWGFVEIIQTSKNQYQACIVKICRGECRSENTSALTSALYQHNNSTPEIPSTEAVEIVLPISVKTKATKARSKKMLFAETPYQNDFELFRSAFVLRFQEYEKYDLEHYFKALTNWGQGSQNEKYKKVDWLLTCKTWIDGDTTRNQPKLKGLSISTQIGESKVKVMQEESNAVILDALNALNKSQNVPKWQTA